jgi:uncharacterized protein YjbK
MKKKHREIELKYELDGEGSYERLCRSLGEPESDTLQINHYFRSPDGRVPGDRGVVRIRVEKGRAVFGVKLGGPLRQGLASSLEYETPWEGPAEEIPSAADMLWESGFQGMKAIEEAFGGRVRLLWVGRMENRRKVYRVQGGLCLEVDASRYSSGAEDFEVELETGEPDRDRPRLEALLDDLGIRYAPQTETKYQRFLRHAGLTCPVPEPGGT